MFKKSNKWSVRRGTHAPSSAQIGIWEIPVGGFVRERSPLLNLNIGL